MDELNRLIPIKHLRYIISEYMKEFSIDLTNELKEKMYWIREILTINCDFRHDKINYNGYNWNITFQNY